MPISRERARDLLQAFDFRRLFLDQLGWDKHAGDLEAGLAEWLPDVLLSAVFAVLAFRSVRISPYFGISGSKAGAKDAHGRIEGCLFVQSVGLRCPWRLASVVRVARRRAPV